MPVRARKSTELIALTDEDRAAWRAGGDGWLDHRLAEGEISEFGSAPGEEWHGREQVAALNSRGAPNDDVQYLDEIGVDETRIEAWEAGDTGWVVAHGVSRSETGQTVPTRSIVVFARDSDGWKRVLAATHVLVPNEDLFAEKSE